MDVRAIGVQTSFNQTFKGNPVNQKNTEALINQLRICAIGQGISTSEIKRADTVDSLKNLIKLETIKRRGLNFDIRPKINETCEQLRERVDFATYKAKAEKMGMSQTMINECKTSSQIKEKLASEDIQKDIFKKVSKEEAQFNTENYVEPGDEYTPFSDSSPCKFL